MHARARTPWNKAVFQVVFREHRKQVQNSEEGEGGGGGGGREEEEEDEVEEEEGGEEEENTMLLHKPTWTANYTL